MQPEVLAAILDATADVIVDTVKTHVSILDQRLDALLEREPLVGPPGPPGTDGVNGLDAPPLDLHEVAKQAAALVPTPKDGRDGVNGDADAIAAHVLEWVSVQMAELIAVEVTKAVASMEKPKDGVNGRDGVNGQDGHTVTVDQITPAIAAEVAKAVEGFPKPKDGVNGRDGVGVAGAVLDQAGNLVLTLSNGTMHPLGVVVGAKGEPGTNGLDGKAGVDGFGFDDLTVDHDGEQTVSLTFAQGDRVKSFPIVFPVPVHKGIFDVTKTYERGYQVTWAGSTWQAVRQTSGFKPGDGSPEKTGWVLVTKKGSDGKSGKAGEPGRHGRDGKDGGAKW